MFLLVVLTQGGGRYAPLPRATIGSPFRAENRLTVGVFRHPLCPAAKICDILTPTGEGANTSGCHYVLSAIIA